MMSTGLLLQAQPIQRQLPTAWYRLDPTQDSVVGISLEKAYGLLKDRPAKTVIVAVIDNGLDITHPALKDVLWINHKETAANGQDDDHNGYSDDVQGWNFRGTADGSVIENEQAASLQYYLRWKDTFEQGDTTRLTLTNKKRFAIYKRAQKEFLEKRISTDSIDLHYTYNPQYDSGKLIANDRANLNWQYYGSPHAEPSSNLSHGTHVAGIIVAHPDQAGNRQGIANHVLIMPILATTAGGDERDKDVANAVQYAVDNGATIISMSFSKRYSADKEWIDRAIRYAEQHDVLIVHAAGNDGVNIDTPDHYYYPTAIYEDGGRAENVITVGWSRALFDERLAHPYSNYGKQNVDLFAPGSDIYSTVPGGGYGSKSGSSMSAPMVTGVAALLRSYFPSLTANK